jgi:hypothetical protein
LEPSRPNPLFELLAEKTTLPNEMHFWNDAAVPSSRRLLDPLRTNVVRF